MQKLRNNRNLKYEMKPNNCYERLPDKVEENSGFIMTRPLVLKL